MTTLYKCDVCDQTAEDLRTRLAIQLTPVGKSWKERLNFDICAECQKKPEIKGFVLMLGLM